MSIRSALLLSLVLLSCGVCAGKSGKLESLPVISGGYPRAFFFRSSESLAASRHVTYEQWDKEMSRLMGIEGKVLEEEIPGRSKPNIEFFTRFKKAHPEQLVLLHFNGNARDPRFQTGEFFAGHWLYFNGAKILADIPAQEGETEIRVSDARLFRTKMGRYRDKNEDVGLCTLDAQGRPNWNESEQVQLVSVDLRANTIRVRRGQFGTRPRAFAAGKAYAAAHVTEGPWGNASNLLWFYNYSTKSPRDPKGRSCAEVLVNDLARRFAPGGELADFDGLEFDVLHHQVTSPKGERGVDSDADGKADRGIIDGINQYGIGVVEFCRSLRAKMGPDKIIQADGMGLGNQRAFGILNGIESEGFPQLRDLEIKDWSGGLNRHFFWDQNAYPPVFNYINHKFNEPDPKTKLPVTPKLPFSKHRLVMAAAVLTNAALCYSFTPEPEPGERIGIWDELRMGKEHKTGWLGKPLGPAVHMAERQRNMLDGASLKRIQGPDVRVAADGKAMKISAAKAETSELRFRLTGVPVNGPDLFVKLISRAQPMRNYPREVARMMQVSLASSPDDSFMTWVNAKDFTSGFYFSNLKSATVDLEFVIEGSEPVWIEGISAYAHPDAMYRQFENGLVLANPPPPFYAFDLAKIAPGMKFRRLTASPAQDTAVNNGTPVSGSVQLGEKDALFLVREK